MTKKDYTRIAAAVKIAHSQEEHAQHGVQLAAVYIAAALAQENPRFNTDTFLTACGALNRGSN